jgi:hypothetical protein
MGVVHSEDMVDIMEWLVDIILEDKQDEAQNQKYGHI